MRRKILNKGMAIVAALSTLCMTAPTLFSACTIVSYRNENVVEENIALTPDDLTSLLQKYDNQGYVYEYNGEPCTITMAHWDSLGSSTERAVLDILLKGFNARYPDIDVDLQIIGSYEGTYGNFIAAGKAADVFLVPDGAVFKWANNLTNLDTYIADSELLNDLSDVYPSCLSRYQYNGSTLGSGRQLALPRDIGPNVMYYNKDWFDEMNVAYPSATEVMTIEQATDMWKSLVKKNSQGKIVGYGVGGLSVEGLVWSAGGDFLNAARNNIPTSQATINAIKKGYSYIQQSYVEDCIQPPASFTGGLDASNLFMQQQVACVISGRSSVTTFRGLGFNWDVAYVPAFTDSGSDKANMLTNGSYSGSIGYTIKKDVKEEKREAAWKLVEYISSKEGQELLALTGFQIPIYESLARDEGLAATEREKGPVNYDVFIDSAKYQRYGLWQYRSEITWKTNIYDLNSEKLNAEKASDRITVDTFWSMVQSTASGYRW